LGAIVPACSPKNSYPSTTSRLPRGASSRPSAESNTLPGQALTGAHTGHPAPPRRSERPDTFRPEDRYSSAAGVWAGPSVTLAYMREADVALGQDAQDRPAQNTTEHRGVPGSSAGLAIRKAERREACVGWPGAFQLPAPSDPGVTVSRHRALLTGRQYERTHCQWANRLGSRPCSPAHQRWNRLWARSRLYFFPAQRFR
jgi:hypothetical protein